MAVAAAAMSDSFPCCLIGGSLFPSGLWGSTQQGHAQLLWLHNGALCCQGSPPPRDFITLCSSGAQGFTGGTKALKCQPTSCPGLSPSVSKIQWERSNDPHAEESHVNAATFYRCSHFSLSLSPLTPEYLKAGVWYLLLLKNQYIRSSSWVFSVLSIELLPPCVSLLICSW